MRYPGRSAGIRADADRWRAWLSSDVVGSHDAIFCTSLYLSHAVNVFPTRPAAFFEVLLSVSHMRRGDMGFVTRVLDSSIPLRPNDGPESGKVGDEVKRNLSFFSMVGNRSPHSRRGPIASTGI